MAQVGSIITHCMPASVNTCKTRRTGSMSKPSASHGSALNEKPRLCAHRPLAENVLHSAREDVAGEVAWQNRHVAQARPGPLRRRVSSFAASGPLTASLLAMALGAVLTLVLQRGLARRKAGF